MANRRSLRKKVSLIGLTITTALLVSSLYPLFRQTGVSYSSFQEMVNHDLPKGTKRATVERWLKAKGFAFTGEHIFVSGRTRNGAATQVPIYLISGESPGSRCGIYGNCRLLFSFQMDQSNRLTVFNLKEFCTSL